MDIRDFLRARWAEERADALAAQAVDPTPWHAATEGPGNSTNIRAGHGAGLVIAADDEPLWDCEGSHTLCMTAPTTRHVARWSPDHVLADLDAKQAILGRHLPGDDDSDPCNTWDIANDRTEQYNEHNPCPDVRALATPYHAHPDYQEGWKP